MSYFAGSDQLPAWVGKPPKEWKTDWLKWHVSLSTERPDEEEQSRLPYLSNEDIASWTGKLLREELEPSEADSRLFHFGDVLFNKLRPYLAKVFSANFNGVSSGELLCLRPSERVDTRYLFYVLTSFGFIDAVDSQTFGSKMPRADWETVGHQPLPLPRIEIQQRIARFLDDKTARIDALIEKKQALLERLAEKRQALITHAVTKGLNQDVPMKPSGVDWVGDMPSHWHVAALGYRYEVQLGRMLNAERADGEHLRPYLRVLDVQWGRINTSDLPLMDFPPEAQKRYRLAPGDLLVNEGGSYVGRSAIFRGEIEECYYQKALHRLRPFDAGSDTADFLYFVMESATNNFLFEGGGNQTTIDHLTAEQFRHYRFAFPPLRKV
ncbi:restriction endonuclease subunit S [Xanthomonas euvesicatoria]|uniref:restriction endonuclease subunit S n=1 Tax=Xanthomonas citri TaxID=346 RepID=UPI000F8144F6|nr:restriction endonuclease subunit S [Xanthomonas axonopodis]MEE5090005.1 restriction endonuclease subunit S [Xanthomonas euvesicatoria]RTE59258.1 restriction endonuclease subunit S [Xanthomonas axonopodis pv. eucalyptorum]